ncbi:unnamed protein product [Brachionus calyciflorus]|uniref:C-type lectin domain-containing protein n=1 Tax=Brachionus calyciflorus TaxID=104777 RepID=A0A813ZIY9_9BILA|nr:unnamed protein product [Brachionus calyciflorus]
MFFFQYILAIFGFLAFSSSVQVHFDSYLVKYYNIIDDRSLLLKIQTLNKFSCLQMCSIESNCVFVNFEKKECILYSYDQTFNLSLSSDRKIYQKKNFDFREKVIPNKNQKSYDLCLNNSEYWSLNTNSCVPCKTGFIKYPELPFNCYHYTTGSRIFTESKSYCQSKSGVLFRPKTRNESYFYTERFAGKLVNVDSSITSLGEKFKWPDGSDVVGFDVGQPNNFGGNGNLAENCLEIRSNGLLNDAPDNKYYNLTICQLN